MQRSIFAHLSPYFPYLSPAAARELYSMVGYEVKLRSQIAFWMQVLFFFIFIFIFIFINFRRLQKG
jgi:amino acid transporter